MLCDKSFLKFLVTGINTNFGCYALFCICLLIFDYKLNLPAFFKKLKIQITCLYLITNPVLLLKYFYFEFKNYVFLEFLVAL